MVCSAGRIRTYNLVLTLNPNVSKRSGLSHHPFKGCEALPLFYNRVLPFGIVSEPSLFQGLAADYHTNKRLGFPQFTSFFDLDFSKKLLNVNMQFSVTVCTNQDTLINFFFHSFSRSCISFIRNSEIFSRITNMMKFKRLNAFVIITQHTFSTFVFHRHFSNFLSSFRNCLY